MVRGRSTRASIHCRKYSATVVLSVRSTWAPRARSARILLVVGDRVHPPGERFLQVLAVDRWRHSYRPSGSFLMLTCSRFRFQDVADPVVLARVRCSTSSSLSGVVSRVAVLVGDAGQAMALRPAAHPPRATTVRTDTAGVIG